MLHQIENKHLICKIESVGAEIRSLKNKQAGQEYIWPINPEVWGSSSPILFPAIGTIKDNHITHKGIPYQMPKHGIIRNNSNLVFEQLSASSCSFTLKSNAETKQQYPFNFIFKVIYTLTDKTLDMTFDIQNLDDEVMYFSCGGHTAYNLPLDENTSLSDYVIEFPNTTEIKSLTIEKSNLLLTPKERHFKLQNEALALSETIFNNDALIFPHIKMDSVRLRRKNEKKGLVVKFTGYPHLALWAKPGADYVCIEPWLGLPDMEDETTDISLKSNQYALQPQSNFSIRIEAVLE